ncbi:MAG: glycosyltransferase family 4 protein [bacterium]
MKIAHIVCAFPPYKGGMGNVAYYFSRELSLFGHEVVVFTADYDKKIKEIDSDGFKVIRLNALLKLGNGAFVPGLYKRLEGFDVVHLHYPFFGAAEIVWLAKIIKRRKMKLVVTYAMDALGLPFFASLLSLPSVLIKNSLLKIADKIICSNFDYIAHSSISKFYENHEEKFVELPYGRDDKKFFPKKNMEVEEGALLNILFVGALDQAHYFKGVDILFSALAKIKIENWQLNIVGKGDLENEYKKQANKLGIVKKINFVGGISDEKLTEYYQNSDLFVLPSINSCEAFGLVLVEAMSCGAPVIASRLPGVRKVFEEGEQGLFVEPGNVDDLAEKIETILKDDDLRKCMSLSAIKYTEEKYDWKKTCKKLEKIYTEII